MTQFSSHSLKIKSCLFFALLSGACSSNDLPVYTELNSLRILALVASQPEVSAGGTTSITPLLSDITESSSLTYVAEACIPASSSDFTCTGNATKQSVSSGTLNTGDMTSARLFTGAASSFNVTVPSSGTIFANRNATDQYNGVAYLVTYTITNSRGVSLSSFKKILVSTRTTLNQNPIVNDILNEGQAFTASLPTQDVNLSLSFGATTAETYSAISSRGETQSLTESLTTTWFATDGKFKYYRTVGSDSNTFLAPESAPSTRDAILIAVTRDGRGGLTYKKKCFGTCP